MATISQIKIGDQIYNICDADNRQTTETINNTLTTINQDLAAIKGRFDSNGILKIANGGTAQSQSDKNALLRALGIAKTAGDAVDIGGFRGAGYVTNARKDFSFTICTSYLFYGVSASNSYITGTYTIRQNNGYHFGCTSDHLTYSFTNHHNINEILINGQTNITISTGVEQTKAVNNDTAGIIVSTGASLNLRS